MPIFLCEAAPAQPGLGSCYRFWVRLRSWSWSWSCFLLRVTVLLDGAPLPQSSLLHTPVPPSSLSLLREAPQGSALPPPCLTVGSAFPVMWHPLQHLCFPHMTPGKVQIEVLSFTLTLPFFFPLSDLWPRVVLSGCRMMFSGRLTVLDAGNAVFPLRVDL